MMLTIRGVSYHVETYGEGTPLVLLHGFTGSAENWHPFLGMFSQYKVILIDLIGHGQTNSPSEFERYSMEESVKDLHAIFAELHLNTFILAGYSMGGRLALTYAVQHPEQIDKLILESASPGLKSEDERMNRRENDRNLSQFIREQGMNHFINFWENIPLFASQKALPEAVQNNQRIQRLKNDETGLANSLLGMGTGSQKSLWDSLDTLKIPVLLLSGERDEKFCGIAKEMKNLLPLSTFIKIIGAGHAVHVEQPQIFGRIVNEFINS
ncbi:2-succinyl-6-hydroxy-2,4-cyclohexadiene-1-carboxylate synthase [Metabacillus idriensis]|uniref:2-succinyl-6-hydroxy-2, 4-cyclohexadiene-1-carboxylate synthase n=1 Tax=Metabacillus idriensis TaxID=324768 RepID=UPI00281372FF|nr:2-succinyl-6-hydroxy-2,4-cyclohexadiene-1-carboxylate synthase [Metabacillus idriensis]MDR0137898.1 2-succinyl-6-hydroxy-2,4-cyclohexadiene-1-carboxylate synthase [Metabacillus idriensis]